MELPDWVTDIFNASAIKKENVRLEEELLRKKALCRALCSIQYSEKNEALYKLMTLQNQYLTLNNQMTRTTSALDACKALTKADKAIISDLTSSIESLTKQLTKSTISLYTKPMPAILKEVPVSNVMLDGFMIKTSSGSQFCEYPSHPSIFQPSPIFEDILTLAKCNCRREDITSVEISKLISNVLQLKMTYISDQKLWGRIDNWTAATVAILMKKDDCETLSAVILSALFYYQMKFGAFKDYSCFMGLGKVKYNGGSYGHGFVLLLHDTSTNLKDSFIIEATDDWASNPMPIFGVKEIYDCSWGIIGYVREDYPAGTYEVKNVWWST